MKFSCLWFILQKFCRYYCSDVFSARIMKHVFKESSEAISKFHFKVVQYLQGFALRCSYGQELNCCRLMWFMILKSWQIRLTKVNVAVHVTILVYPLSNWIACS